MRPIRFRAWDGAEGRMLTDGFILETDSRGTITAWVETEEGRYQVELLQFTGLHDAKGKEIYEGDILTDWGFGGSVGKPKLEVMRWDKTHWEPSSSFKDWDKCIMTYEVLGNIYENPELVSGKEKAR